MIFINVDLPDPLRPTRQIRSPADREISALSSKGVAPNVRPIPASWMMGGGMVVRTVGSGTAARTAMSPCGRRRNPPHSPQGESDVKSLLIRLMLRSVAKQRVSKHEAAQ